MKFKTALVIFFLFSGLAVHYGQHDRNTLYVHYTPQITRTFFETMLENNPGLFIDFVETTPANRPIQGHSLGGGYRRQFGKLSIGLHFSQNLRGQRSAYAFNYRGSPNTDTTRNYGGLYYHFKTKSFSFGISGGLALLSNEQYAGGPEITLGLDVFHYAYAEEFTIRPGEGTLGGGCCRMEVFRVPGSYFNALKTSFGEGYYRADFSFGWRNEFQLYRNLHLNLQPNVYFLTGILKKSPELNVWIPDGIVIAAGLKMETVFKF